MIKYQLDTMVDPASQWFVNPINTPDGRIIPLKDSAFYLEDWLGVRALDEAGKISFVDYKADHLNFNSYFYLLRDVIIPTLWNENISKTNFSDAPNMNLETANDKLLQS